MRAPGLGRTQPGCACACSPPLPLTPRRMRALLLSHRNTICPRRGPQQFYPTSVWAGECEGSLGAWVCPCCDPKVHPVLALPWHSQTSATTDGQGWRLAAGPWVGEGPDRHGRKGWRGRKTQLDLSVGRNHPLNTHTRTHA